MRLKYLTLCVLGLSLSACSQHVIKSTAGQQQPLGERASSALNAVFETSSYDMQGQLSIQIQPDSKAAKGASAAAGQPPALDPEVKKQLDQAIKAQKIQLSAKEKSQLYAAIARQHHPEAGLHADAKAGMADSMANLLNDMQFEYDGSVHYRQKMGSFNLTARYEKPTLLVQAKVPMVLDLNDYKFYINYFALMPYLVNKENQNNLAYLDFSKYQHLFKQVDIKKFAEYVKASSAVYYRLANPNDIQALAVSSNDHAAGVVEKIRLKTSVEELILQANLYSKVNKKYLVQQVLNFKEKNLEKLVADEVDAVVQSKVKSADSSVLASKNSADDASVVSQQLYRLVNQHLGVDDADESYSSASEDAAQAAEQARDATEEMDVLENNDEAAADEQGLTAEQCLALQNTAKTTYGDVQYC